MFALIIVPMVLAGGGCQEKCATDASRCYGTCSKGSSATCNDRCDSRSADCNASCSSVKAKAREEKNKNVAMPCDARLTGGRAGDVKPCPDEQARVFEEALNSREAKQTLKCKSETGLPIPCKGDTEAADDLLKDVGEKDICVDDSGQPRLCKDSEKKVTAKVKKR